MSSSDPLFASQIRAELDRILASDIFARSERLSGFLTFIVERTLAGEWDTLKEHVIAIEVYGKGPDFNTAADPIVRVDARRLRDKLREFYATRGTGDTVISVPKGGYTPAFTTASAVITAGVSPALAASPRASPMWWIAGAIGLSIVILGAWLAYTRIVHQRGEPVRLLTVTSLPGAEEDPAISPDGNFVVFSWNATGKVNADLWVKAVDGDAMRQLTDTPGANEKFAEWSPDGQSIAFTRFAEGWPSVWMVSSLGGPERMIATRGSSPSWLPDGKSVVMIGRTPVGTASLVLHTLDTGERRQLTEAPVGFNITHPQVSPDGQTVVFAEYGAGRSALFLAALNGGEATQLVDWTNGGIGGLNWSPDGRDVIYARPEMSGRRLVRFTLGSREPPVPVPGAPHGSLASSASRLREDGSYRLAIFSGQPDIGLRLVDLEAPRQGDSLAATTFCDATRMDTPGRFSGDGSQVAFVSDRNGTQQVWVAGRDQSGCRSVTNLQNASVNVGSWSPDGRSIVFDATADANTDIYVVSVDGGPPKRLTDGPAVEMYAEWSHDGRWIYYASNETGRSEIWRMSIDGRTRLKLTSDGGFDPRESPNGQFVYFVAEEAGFGLGPGTRLLRVPAAGGATSVTHAEVMAGAWGLAGDTVVFLLARQESSNSNERDVVVTYHIADERLHELGPLPFRVGPYGVNRFFTVSRDGRWALAAHIDRWDRDILVLDNFR